MPIRNALASVAVKDLAAAVRWYERLFQRAPDTRPMPGLAEWKFEEGGWLQVYLGPERAGGCSVTLVSGSLDEQITALKKMGVDPGRPMVSETTKAVMVKDPDGNSIAFAESLVS